jgi:hypothetical protein
LPELPPWPGFGWRLWRQLLQLALARAPALLDLERMRDSEGFAIAAPGKRAPAHRKASELLVVNVGQLGRCRDGSHVVRV